MNNAVNVAKEQALLEDTRSASKADLNAEVSKPAEEQGADVLARYATELAARRPPPCGC